MLTPAGLKTKSQLTYAFLKFTMDFYGQMEVKLRECLSEMAAAGVRRVVLYGASDVARILTGLMDGQMAVVGVVDAGYEGHDFHGAPVVRALDGVVWDGVLITALDGVDEAEAALVAQGVKAEAIWTVA